MRIKLTADTAAYPHLDEKKKCLDASAELFGLSEDEKVNPNKYTKYWFIPSQMLNSKMVCNEKQRFLEEIYYWRYKQISDGGVDPIGRTLVCQS